MWDLRIVNDLHRILVARASRTARTAADAPHHSAIPTMRRFVAPALLVAFVAGSVGLALYWNAPPAPRRANEPEVGKARVKLAVLVVFDQMRGDFPEKWKPLFGPKGFVRLQTEGATFTRCNYPYATTTTGPGHASMLSGTCADRHGIVNNHWFEKGEVVYCAGSQRYELVPPPATKPDPKKPKE